MNTGTVLLIGGVAIVAVFLLTRESTPQYAPTVPSRSSNEGEMAAGANAVASVLNSSMKVFGSAMGYGGY